MSRPGIEQAATMAAAVQDLLEALDDEQRTAVTYSFDDAERLRWFYTPTDHGGLALSEMSSRQHPIVHRLLAAALSEAGHTTVSTIIGLENVLDRVEGFGVSYGRERGRDPLLYWLAIFGDPDSADWSWRFGGHHVSLHFTIRDGKVASSTPLFLGADPASSTLLGPHPLRPLGGAEDLARELFLSLDDETRATVHLSMQAPVDIIGANRTQLRDGDSVVPLDEIWRARFVDETDEYLRAVHEAATAKAGWTGEHQKQLALSAHPKGAPVTRTEVHRRLLRKLLGCYLEQINPTLADEQWKRAEQHLDELHFLWAGGTRPGEPHYYRLQGGNLLIEYDNTQRDVNHVHTVWRDLSMDFGGDPLAQHYVDHH
jgi:hypothetical protein